MYDNLYSREKMNYFMKRLILDVASFLMIPRISFYELTENVATILPSFQKRKKTWKNIFSLKSFQILIKNFFKHLDNLIDFITNTIKKI